MLDKTQTTMRAAFARAGLREADAELHVANAKYLNVTNGDVAGLLECAHIDIEKYKLSGKGHIEFVEGDHCNHAQPRQPVGDETGLLTRSSNGHDAAAPSSSSNRGGEDQLQNASNGQASGVLSVREPSAGQIAASRKVMEAAAAITMSVFDRVKTSDGKAWGDVGAHELAGMSRDGTLAAAITNHLGPLSDKDRFKTIRELMKPEQFDKLRTAAGGQVDAA